MICHLPVPSEFLGRGAHQPGAETESPVSVNVVNKSTLNRRIAEAKFVVGACGADCHLVDDRNLTQKPSSPATTKFCLPVEAQQPVALLRRCYRPGRRLVTETHLKASDRAGKIFAVIINVSLIRIGLLRLQRLARRLAEDREGVRGNRRPCDG